MYMGFSLATEQLEAQMGSVAQDQYVTRSSHIPVRLPLFIPVYRPDYPFVLFNDKYAAHGLNAVMVNAFLLYRDRQLRKKFEDGYALRDHLGGFGGMLCTDSGAFQQLKGRKVELDPLDIVRFQNRIQTDIAAPLDLITPPETSYEETVQRMLVSHHRIAEAVKNSDYADLAGIQQGGGFYSLRMQHIRQLAEIGFRYYGIGSMVPFFNKNHDLHFTCAVIRDAREVIGPSAAMHVYGAGDPLDMAFMFYAGANVFDSSSYAHYAYGGFYMTPYGAVCRAKDCEKMDYACTCPICGTHGLESVFGEKGDFPLMQQHNLFVLLDTVRVLGEKAAENALEKYVSRVYSRHLEHSELFPKSRLGPSWECFLSKQIVERAGEKAASQAAKTKQDGTVLSDLEEQALQCLADEITADYKADPHRVYAFLTEELGAPKNRPLRRALSSAGSLQGAQRLSDYKLFRKKARGAVYQDLRRYKTSDYDVESGLALFAGSEGGAAQAALEQLLHLHVSTRERLPYREEYIERISGLAAPGSTIIDIGCGFHPLMLPPEFYRRVACYVAADKDAQCVEAVRMFAAKFGLENLRAFTWDIGQGLAALERMTGVQEYDLALLMKVVPAVYRAEQTHAGRHDAGMVSVLGQFPAKKMLAMVSRESMTKHKSIEKRELSSLNRFIDTYGFTKAEDISAGDEAGYLLAREEKP